MSIKNKLKYLIFLIAFLPLIAANPSIFTNPKNVYAVQAAVNLLTTTNFAVLGGSAISDTPTSTITGDVGLSPGGGSSITGITCSEITGTLYDNDGGYAGGGSCRVTNASKLTQAKNDLVTAYNDAAGRSTTSTIPTQLGGTTLTDGVYDSATGTFGITGTLTLDGQGNANSVFIFKMASTLITASASKVVLTNGAQACNVFWQVGSSTTLGTGSTLVGNVLALTSITDNGGSTVFGRLLARNGAVTLNNTKVAVQNCAATGGSSSSSNLNTVSIPYCPPISNLAVTPTIIESRRVSPTSIFLSWGPYSGINTFNVRYGPSNGNWLYNVDVTGMSTNINDLPANQPMWFEVAVRNECQIGEYGPAKLAGGPILPNTGFEP